MIANRNDAQSVFRALADPTRRAIIEMLAEQPRSIGQIAAQFDVTRPAIAKHLRILEDGDLIKVRIKGRERINSLNVLSLRKAADWLSFFDSFWDDRLETLKSVVEKEQ